MKPWAGEEIVRRYEPLVRLRKEKELDVVRGAVCVWEMVLRIA